MSAPAVMSPEWVADLESRRAAALARLRARSAELAEVSERFAHVTQAQIDAIEALPEEPPPPPGSKCADCDASSQYCIDEFTPDNPCVACECYDEMLWPAEELAAVEAERRENAEYKRLVADLEVWRAHLART